MRRARSLGFLFFSIISASACGGGSAPEAGAPPPWTVGAALGVYDDGCGRQGLAVVATVRDASGAGPSATWPVTLRHESGATVAFSYDSPGTGSHAALWTTDSAPYAGRWDVEADSGDVTVPGAVTLPAGEGLPIPAPALAADGSSVDWAEVPGAAAYVCRLFAGGTLQLEETLASPGCDLTSLPSGAYVASILALSFDPSTLGGSEDPAPALPGRFDVSEGRLGVVRTDGSSPAKSLLAAGGAYDNGVGPRSIAVWLSLSNADGSAVAEDWDVQVVGPGLPVANPLTTTYWAGFPRLMVWAVGVPALAGTYTVTATSGAAVAATQFTVGASKWLPMPTGVSASDGAQGSASVSWSPVAGAAAYLASAYDGVTGALVASQWTPATSTGFPAGTFTAGRRYDVFVSVTDADMVGGAVPTQFSVAENVFDYSTFVAR